MGNMENKAYGSTYEPVVFIYNKRLIPQADMPDTHIALAKLIVSQPDKFKRKVTTYDIEKIRLRVHVVGTGFQGGSELLYDTG